MERNWNLRKLQKNESDMQAAEKVRERVEPHPYL